MGEQQNRIRVCKLLGGTGVASRARDDGDLCGVVALPGDDLLHRRISGTARVLLALNRRPRPAQLGDDIDALIPLAPDVLD